MVAPAGGALWQMIEKPLRRFAQGWDQVKLLSPEDMQVIREHDLKYDFWSALNAGGSAHPPPVDFFTDPVAATQFCPDPQRWLSLFQKALRANDEVLIGILWMHCLGQLSRKELEEMESVLGHKGLFGWKYKEHGSVAYSDWFRAAKVVIESDGHVKDHKPAMARRMQRML